MEDSGGATIFNVRDRPSIMHSDSYAIGGGKQRAEQRSSSFDNRTWKNIGSNLPRLPTLPAMPTMPNMPSLPEIPTWTLIHSKSQSKGDTSRREVSRRKSLRQQESGNIPQDEQEGVQMVTPETSVAKPLKHKLVDLHAKHPNLRDMSRPLLPIAIFPNQGTGTSSEYYQDTPIWSRQPFKLMYFAYFGLTVGLFFLPWFALTSIFISQRARRSWSWKRSTLVKLYRHGTRLTFRTYTSLSRDITKEVPHSKTVRAKFVWVEGLPDEAVQGEIRRIAKLQNLKPTRTCGFWYGERDGGGGVGQRATAGEKVVYHLHGGAYWIGTAHEKDVTSAVNMEVLRALDKIYQARLPEKQSKEDGLVAVDPMPSPKPPNGGPASHMNGSGGPASGGHCKRSFSLDYRLCVPEKPEMGSYPAALLDALAGYRYLVQECGFEPRNIIIAGDSAGGNLGLALCRYLRDTKVEEMAGALVLLSPWADASRSHSGPTTAPNKFSSSYFNRDCDIISPSLAFRNTAVGALLGKLSASEAYKNPYFSSVSLQLAPENGGSGPDWGFTGFPKRIYVCTGSAELSYDQHLTLAYRLAGGTKNRMPIHRGDKLSINEDPFELSARLNYPRPHDHEITLWPSAVGTPAGVPLLPPSKNDKMQQSTSSLSRAALDSVQGEEEEAREVMMKGKGEEEHKRPAEQKRMSLGARLKSANGYLPAIMSKWKPEEMEEGLGEQESPLNYADGVLPPSTSAAAANDTRFEAGQGPNQRQVKEKDTAEDANVTHDNERRGKEDFEGEGETADELAASRRNLRSKKQKSTATAQTEGNPGGQRVRVPTTPNHTPEETYFDIGGEDRTVVLDECKDAIHDYTLFNWYEPERGNTWKRIAQWIDEEV
ncbi:hypothetical protein CBS101457_005283 [Exobasidium rhododendri]|nr:hypothetical protein CBS101457_005283 [Exobasidium rhododendri]